MCGVSGRRHAPTVERPAPPASSRRTVHRRPRGRPPPVGYARRVSPKTLTGEELQLDDGPAKGSELFLVDGNNLAYRAFFALPEELQTTDGQPTNALLGFTNMLFKLLSDYAPRGVAVAWDTRPTHRTEIAETYKEGRRPMPDLLREQFPHLPADRRGVRLSEPRVRGLGGRRRDRHARDARRRGGDQDVRRLHRPRRLPALLARTSR